MTASPCLTITGLRLRGVHVPMRRPLVTRGGTVGVAPLALIDLHTDQGVTGSTYLFCYTPLVLQPVLQMLANLEPQDGRELVGAARHGALPRAGGM